MLFIYILCSLATEPTVANESKIFNLQQQNHFQIKKKNRICLSICQLHTVFVNEPQLIFKRNKKNTSPSVDEWHHIGLFRNMVYIKAAPLGDPLIAKALSTL